MLRLESDTEELIEVGEDGILALQIGHDEGSRYERREEDFLLTAHRLTHQAFSVD